MNSNSAIRSDLAKLKALLITSVRSNVDMAEHVQRLVVIGIVPDQLEETFTAIDNGGMIWLFVVDRATGNVTKEPLDRSEFERNSSRVLRRRYEQALILLGLKPA